MQGEVGHLLPRPESRKRAKKLVKVASLSQMTCGCVQLWGQSNRGRTPMAKKRRDSRRGHQGTNRASIAPWVRRHMKFAAMGTDALAPSPFPDFSFFLVF